MNLTEKQIRCDNFGVLRPLDYRNELFAVIGYYIKTYSVVHCNYHHYCKKFQKIWVFIRVHFKNDMDLNMDISHIINYENVQIQKINS